MFKNVVMMLIAPRIDDAPETCTAKIAKSIDMPASDVESGGYKTQPTPEPNWPLPPGANIDATPSDVPAMNNQNDKLFKRGKAMSGAPICNGMK